MAKAPAFLGGERPLARLRLKTAIGSWLFCTDGSRLLDASSGLICVNVGHANPRVQERIAGQSTRGAFASPAVFEPEEQEKLAARLTEAARRPRDTVALSTSGTLGVELAINMARLASRAAFGTSKSAVLTTNLSYHGQSALTLALSGHRRRRPKYGDGMGQEPAFAAPYQVSHQHGHEQSASHDCTWKCASEVSDAIDMRGQETVAAVLIEPITGSSGGGFVPPPGYLAEVSRLCRERDVLVIHDEVITGLGRTGLVLGSHHWDGVSPDICVVSKGLGAGYTPVAAVLLNEYVTAAALAENAGPLPMFGTMSGAPLQAAICHGVLDELEAVGALSDEFRGTRLQCVMDAIQRDYEGLIRTRGRGFLHGLELPDGTLWKFIETAQRHGLLLYPFSGFRDDGGGEGVMVAPPLNSSDEEIDFLEEALRSTLTDVLRP